MSNDHNQTAKTDADDTDTVEATAPRIVFGLLDNSADFPDESSAIRARDLTISWARFKYSGIILEDISVHNILQRAAGLGAGHCLIQSYGHILAEIWRADAAETPEIMQALDDWVSGHDYLACGVTDAEAGSWYGLDKHCLLVNLQALRRLGREPFREKLKNDGACDFPASIKAGLFRLDRLNPSAWEAGQPPDATGATSEKQETDHADEAFLANIHHLTDNLRNAIFVWNLETYEDIETPASEFSPPLDALYTVSAGFKPNRILETHGFNQQTRMVVFDYSPQGLQFRQMLHEQWQGIDYPSFLKKLFQKVSPAEAHYLLWDGMSPENLDWRLVNRRWQEELDAWGGEEALYLHWQKFRKLKVEYLNCNILTENQRLVETVSNQDNALIWWSNAFFSVYSNWFYSIPQRQQMYRSWIERLAQKAPNIFMYGSDCHNISVNIYRARDYADWLQNLSDRAADKPCFDVLEPSKFHQYDMRY